MAYAIITTCFVRVEYFNNIFNFEFSADNLRKRVVSKLSKGGSWVSALLTVEIKAKQSFKRLALS